MPTAVVENTETIENTVPPTAGTTIPTQLEIVGRITAAMSEGRNLEDLTVTEVLGLSQPRINTAQANIPNQQPPRLSDNYRRSRRELGIIISSGATLTIGGAGGRDFIRTQLADFIAELDTVAVVEVSQWLGSSAMRQYIADGIMYVQFPETFSTSTVTLGTTSFRIASQEVVDRFSNSDSWTVVTAPWNEACPAAAVHSDGRSVVFFLDLFLTATGRWVRSGDPTAHMAAFRSIMEVVRPMLTSIWQPPVTNPEDAQIRDAVSSFTAIRGLGMANMGRFEADIAESKRLIERATRDIESYRNSLLTQIRIQQDEEDKLVALETGGDARIAEGINEAFTSMEQITRLACVKEVSFAQFNDGGRRKPSLKVVFKDLSLNVGSSHGQRLIEGLTIYILLDRGDAYPIRFHTEGRNPHPHVTSGGSPCWGRGLGAITEAVGRRDWVTTITLISMWAIRYNHSSPHATRDYFPRTDIPAGWINN
jgi:hypothetical protein